MPGRDVVRAHVNGVIEKSFEFDLGVAQHIGIWRAPRLILFEEQREHALFVFSGKIHCFQIDTDAIGDRCGVDQIDPRGTIFIIVIVFPVFHE